MHVRYFGVPYDRTHALMTGAVRPEGIDFEYIAGLPNDIFRRMFAGADVEASELSASNYVMERARGVDRFVALPIFPSRVFRHNTVYVNTAAGVERPEDLRGRRIGLPEYLQTANFWVRGFLQHDYGVAPTDVHWVRQDAEKLSYALPVGLDVTDAPHGRALGDMLEAGEIDALIHLHKPRSFVAGSPAVRRLFPDYAKAEADYYQRTGHFPIMHLVVLRREVYEADRSLARRLYDAFVTAKEQSYELLRESGFLATEFPLQVSYVEETRALFGDDPFPYGMAANRHTMGALVQYVHEQGMIDRAISLDELFAAELLDT
ncbi:MAG TPA: ABC transporter substrate-binding protein [Chloroflexota bacterium]